MQFDDIFNLDIRRFFNLAIFMFTTRIDVNYNPFKLKTQSI